MNNHKLRSTQKIEVTNRLLIGLCCFIFAMKCLPYFLSQFGMSIDPAITIYPWNFSPMWAFCLFGAAFLKDRLWALMLPVLVWFAGDLCIGLLMGHVKWSFYPDQPTVYLSYLLLIATGFWLRENHSAGAVIGTSFAGALLFFIVSNFGQWALNDGTLYPHTASGLLDCYIKAIPFFRNALISLAVYMPILFSPPVLELAGITHSSNPLSTAGDDVPESEPVLTNS